MAPEMASSSIASKKRKDPPYSSTNGRNDSGKGRAMKRNKILDARFIMTQTADAALKNGDLDLQSFLNAREYEIKALEDGMQKSKGALSTRAFQQVPRDMRRRTASHNVKRVPTRLQKRAAREMKEDNTPTVNANKRKPGSSRARIRAETAKKLGILAEKKRAAKGTTNAAGITTRAARPKLRKNALNHPPKPPSKFRKRQIHKTWLPTHLWHAKRAKMTEPKEPLWRMSLPLNSTEKSYRPTHRSGGGRGAVAWDMSYISTIGLRGSMESLGKVLLAIGIPETDINAAKGAKWRAGKRSWNRWLSREVKEQKLQISPAIAFWDMPTEVSDRNATNVSKNSMRQVLIRIHPSAFLETWTELLRLSKLQHPNVQLEDLRFEMGSIEITGPGSTEALLGILHPYYQSEHDEEAHAQTFTSLAGITNPASLPANSILSFSIMDPRLRYPPRKVELPDPGDEEATLDLMEILSTWPVDMLPASSSLFDRDLRYKATRLPSQKALNRRKSLAPPGTFPSISERDPSIPIMLFTSRMSQSSAAQGSWTLLAPWKCILPIWYGLMHFPLSSGGNPRFGGLQELRQSHFEHGVPWFPADYPGTNAGYAWEVEQREKRKREWDKRPKGKRVEWKSLDLGGGRKGELGLGWACDFEKVAELPALPHGEQDKTVEPTDKPDANPFTQLRSKEFSSLISSPTADLPALTELATIRLTFLTRGVATPCARIYRLPAEPASSEGSINSTSTVPVTLRQEWLSLVPAPLHKKPLPNPKAKDLKNLGKIPFNTPLPQRVQLLAKSLLQNPPLQYPKEENDVDNHPIVPDEEYLIGFVTTGEYNLAEGKGIAIGTVVAAKILKGLRSGGLKEGRLCIVRNAGETTGRLARWDVV